MRDTEPIRLVPRAQRENPKPAKREQLCQLDRWQLRRVIGLTPGYLVLLFCAGDRHIHHAAILPTYRAARDEMRRWKEDVFGPEMPQLLIEDRVHMRLIGSQGQQWVLRPE